ncbi:hypothetical protein [Neisseria polysaccharea]|nr:hypothetical protein [Neisseria polysaccharea]
MPSEKYFSGSFSLLQPISDGISKPMPFQHGYPYDRQNFSRRTD